MSPTLTGVSQLWAGISAQVSAAQGLMTWGQATDSLAVALLYLFVPGYLVARASGFARLQAVGGAPALGMAAIGTLSVIFHLATIPFTSVHVGVGLVLLTLATLACQSLGLYVSARSRGYVASRVTVSELAVALWRFLRAPRPWWPIVCSVGLASFLLAVAVMRGIGDPTTPMQASDGLWHLNALAYVRAERDAYPIGSLAAMYWGQVHYYPTGWHALAAVIPGQPTVAANTLSVLGVAVVWPLGCASLLTAVLRPVRRRLIAAIPLLLGILASAAFVGPAVVTAMVWPYAWSVCLLPGVLALILVNRPRALSAHMAGRRRVATRSGGWAGAVLACMGLVAVHGAAVFNLAVTAIPVLLAALLTVVVRQWRRGRIAQAMIVTLLVASLGAVLVGAYGFRDQLLMLWRQQRGGANPWVVARQILHDAPMVSGVAGGSYGFVALSAVAVLGAIVVVIRRRYRWAPLVALIAAFLMVTSVLSGSPLQQLSAAWYMQRARIAPVLELALLVLVAVALEELHEGARSRPVRDCLRLIGKRRGLTRATASTMAWMAALVLACGGVAIPSLARWQAVQDVIADSYQPQRSPWKIMLSEGEADFIRSAARLLPAGAKVLGEPTNGSAYFWALTGHDVVYPTLRQYTDPSRLYLAAHASQVLYDPQVCHVLRSLGVEYLYTDSDTTGGGAPGGGETARFRTTFSEIPAQALEVVASKQSWTLWKITYCALDGAHSTDEAEASGEAGS